MCSWDVMRADCDRGWFVVPTRHSVELTTWTPKLRDYNYSILTYPYLPSMYGAGLHAVTFDWNKNKQINAERAHIEIDDLLSAQGSCWFQHTQTFLDDGPLDHENLYFYQESQETMMRRWMRGWRCIINKKTYYCHAHKGRDNVGADGRIGRGFYLDLRKKRTSEAYSTDYWLNDRCPGATRTFVSLIEQFWPLISRMEDPRYAWPDNWRDFEGNRLRFENRTPEKIPAHI